MLLKTIFKNTNNIILVFYENCFYSLNLIFIVYIIFFRTEKIGNKHIHCKCFTYSPYFSDQETVFKTGNQTNPNIPTLDHSTHLITVDYSTLNYSMVLPNSKSFFIVLPTFVILTFFSKRPDCIWKKGNRPLLRKCNQTV